MERDRIGTVLGNMRRNDPLPAPQPSRRRNLLLLPLCAIAVAGIYLGTGARRDGAEVVRPAMAATLATAPVAAPVAAPPAAPVAETTSPQPTSAPIASANSATPANETAKTVEPPSAQIALEASGTVVAKRVATVSSSVTGRLAKILVEEGEHVTEGQPIALLDTEQALRATRGAEARMRAAEIAAEVADAKAVQTRISLDRTNVLADRGLVPKQQLQDAVALNNVSQAEVRAQRQQIDVQREEVEIARQAIDDATIRAPFSGVVTELNANLGEIVSPLSSGGFTRTGVGTIVDFSSLLVEVDVSEQYLDKLRTNQKVTLTTPAYPDLTLDGRIKLITPNVDPATAAIKVSIAFDAPDPRFFPGMRVDASFLAPDRTARAD
ncbi:efflux RND transporter periplasmic adaptor subunit [Paracoccus aminophilus]|uniref:efflux RND transporter periplasmic adaptor subunit n=1 Tax=Paracoccus aminophilus TaxID=34003 RepID=UPI00130D8D6F|nr:efflux RND transporter periplasmic adaptor subunit [Paracoccus aminophilus]